MVDTQTTFLRDAEVLTELDPDIPQIRTAVHRLIGGHPEGSEDVGMGDPLPLHRTELILNQSFELR